MREEKALCGLRHPNNQHAGWTGMSPVLRLMMTAAMDEIGAVCLLASQARPSPGRMGNNGNDATRWTIRSLCAAGATTTTKMQFFRS